MHTLVAVAALTTLLAGASTTSYAVSRGETAHGVGTTVAVAEAAARKAPTPRIVQPGEHVVAAPGFEFWMTAEGKHWLEPDLPDFPQFRSVVDGNIDLSRPGVSLQASAFEGRYYLSGLYYGGKGTASRVAVRTSTGTVHGELIELPGKPGWGVWYAIADLPTVDDGQEFLRGVTVRDTEGGVYSRLRLR